MENQEIDMGIRVIFGKFGAGKGTLNAMFACSEMEDSERFENSLKYIEYLSELKGRNYTYLPQGHCVYSTFTVKYNGKTTYDFDPDKFMLPNNEFDYSLFPPWSSFHVDESQSGNLCSYDWSKFPKPSLLAFSRVRHPHYLWTLDLQFVTNLNKNIRKFAFEYLTPLDIQNEYNCLNQLVKTSVIVGVFKVYENAVKYEETLDSNLIEEYRVYSHNGNIYDCFDSYGKLLEFFDSDKDFSYSKIKISDYKNSEKPFEEIVL